MAIQHLYLFCSPSLLVIQSNISWSNLRSILIKGRQASHLEDLRNAACGSIPNIKACLQIQTEKTLINKRRRPPLLDVIVVCGGSPSR